MLCHKSKKNGMDLNNVSSARFSYYAMVCDPHQRSFLHGRHYVEIRTHAQTFLLEMSLCRREYSSFHVDNFKNIDTNKYYMFACSH